jgi:hypothetical protein
MKKAIVLQDAKEGTYWYGFYSNKRWTTDISEAKRFESDEDCARWIAANEDELAGMTIIVVHVWI